MNAIGSDRRKREEYCKQLHPLVVNEIKNAIKINKRGIIGKLPKPHFRKRHKDQVNKF